MRRNVNDQCQICVGPSSASDSEHRRNSVSACDCLRQPDQSQRTRVGHPSSASRRPSGRLRLRARYIVFFSFFSKVVLGKFMWGVFTSSCGVVALPGRFLSPCFAESPPRAHSTCTSLDFHSMDLTIQTHIQLFSGGTSPEHCAPGASIRPPVPRL